jgi:hypothetical protein
MDSLYRNYGPGPVEWLYSARGAKEHYRMLTSMTPHDVRLHGKKEVAVMLRFRGKYFGEDRLVVVSGRVRHDVGFVSYLDAYPPMVRRDMWEFIYPGDGDTIAGAVSISLSTSSDPCPTPMVPERGRVDDLGGAAVAGIELVFSEITDSIALAWKPDTTWRLLDAASVLALPNHRFGFPLTGNSSMVCPVAWHGIETSTWNDGYYLLTILTTDCYGNSGVAPLYEFPGGPTLGVVNTNPEHIRIVTNNHVYE